MKALQNERLPYCSSSITTFWPNCLFFINIFFWKPDSMPDLVFMFQMNSDESLWQSAAVPFKCIIFHSVVLKIANPLITRFFKDLLDGDKSWKKTNTWFNTLLIDHKISWKLFQRQSPYIISSAKNNTNNEPQESGTIRDTVNKGFWN